MKHRTTLMNRMATALLILAVALLVVPAQAADNTKLAELKTSLNSVPEDASLYLGMFRAGEQIEAIGNSNAWQKLTQSPAVQLGWAMYQMQSADPSTPAGKATAMLEDAQVQDLLALLADMFDDEAFVYADSSLVDSLSLMQKFQRLNFSQGFSQGFKSAQARKAQNFADMSDEEREAFFEKLQSRQKAQAKRALKLAIKNLDAIKVPTVVFGSKLDNTDRAEINLGKLEFILGMGLMQAAQQQPNIDFKEVIKREKIDDSSFLVITLSGKMIPWEEDNPLVQMAEEDENAAKLVEKIKSEKLVIAMGVKDDYFLISIGSSLDEVKKFGQGTALVSRPEMAKLEPYAGEPITDISYVSEALMALNMSYQKDIQVAFSQAKKQLGKVTQLSQGEKDQIVSDLKKLGKDLKSVLPTPGAVASVSFMTSNGGEQYTFSWAVGGPGEQPLELLNHVGGSPILAVVAACPMNIDTYDAVANWANVGWGYFEKYGLPNMPEKKQAEVKEATELLGPIVLALHETTREKFLPAFGGEFAIQADTELQLSCIPGVDKTMPMIEPALILSVKDKDLMDDAIQSYWEIIGTAIAAAGEKCDEMAKVQLPTPSTIEGDAGKMYVFDLPYNCPANGEVEPTVGLGTDTLVFAATQEAAQRLMKETPLSYEGVLADASKPRISAGCFAWKNLIVAGTPWVMFGIEKALEESNGDCPLPPDAIKSQAKTILEVLSVIRKITVEKYRDGDVIVIHSETEIKDVD